MQKNNIFTYTACPICNSQQLQLLLTVKDYTVSQKQFNIVKCKNCQFKITQNIPTQESIGAYYESEDYISHTDTQKGLVNNLYHFARNYMLKSKRKTIEKHVKSGNLLDIGCGTGYFLNEMKLANWNVMGLEVDEGAKQVCKNKFGIDAQNISTLFDFTANTFDVITMWHVLEHVHDLNGYIAQIKKILKPNGKVFIAVPNNDCYDANYYFVHWAAWDVPRHLYHFEPKTMEALLCKHGLKVEQKQWMPFDPFYISLLSEKYMGGNFQLVKGFWNGLISLVKAWFNVDKASSVIYVVRQ